MRNTEMFLRLEFIVVVFLACPSPKFVTADNLTRGELKESSSSLNDFNNTTNTTDESAETESILPSEIQKAVCTVTAGEVRASAEAVTTKTLKGVCSSDELNSGLTNLENRLYNELREIRALVEQLNQLHGLSAEKPNNNFKGHRWRGNLNTVTAIPSFSSAISMPTPPSTTRTITAIKYPTVKNIHGNNGVKNDIPNLKSLKNIKNGKMERDKEVSQFNNTLLTDHDFKIFTYYWKLENFSKYIEPGLSTTIESPIFSIKGKPMRLKAIFQHLQRDFLYMQLSFAHLKTSNNNNIMLETEGLFKQIKGCEHVCFKHKISILDQNNQRSKDLTSQEYNNLESGFSIPNSALLESPYIKNNTLLIQIIFYL